MESRQKTLEEKEAVVADASDEGKKNAVSLLTKKPLCSVAEDRESPKNAAPSSTDGCENDSGKDRQNFPASASSSPAGAASNVLPIPNNAGGGNASGGCKTVARSSRKAAKRAGERMAEKKKSKQAKKSENSKKNKTEEDPWVQCDRCHKWRHLPNSVDLESLPEHWFCELNVYDPKRSTCEAPEQTPKEVAKEKKKALKKLRKLQIEHQQETQALAAPKESEGKGNEMKGSRRGRSNSPKNVSDQEAEFNSSKTAAEDKTTSTESDARGKNNAEDKDETTTNASRDDSPKPPFAKPKGKRGRPRNQEKEQPKQEWVQCEKCQKWRRLPPRISAEDLPDVWYCSMNTWDINLATCTAIEDKHEANTPPRGAVAGGTRSNASAAAAAAAASSQQYSEQSQIPTSFGSSSKLSYRNLIFGSGRRQKNVSERGAFRFSQFLPLSIINCPSQPPTHQIYIVDSSAGAGIAVLIAAGGGSRHERPPHGDVCQL